MTLATADRLAIHELIGLHGHLADDGRADELDLLLTDDARYDIEDFGMGVVTGLAALRELWTAAPGEQPLAHHVTNIVVTETASGVRVRSKGLAVTSNGDAGTVVYDDIVIKTRLGWRISSRKVIAPSGRARMSPGRQCFCGVAEQARGAFDAEVTPNAGFHSAEWSKGAEPRHSHTLDSP